MDNYIQGYNNASISRKKIFIALLFTSLPNLRISGTSILFGDNNNGTNNNKRDINNSTNNIT